MLDFLTTWIIIGAVVALLNSLFVADGSWENTSWKPFVAWLVMWPLVVIAWIALLSIHFYGKYHGRDNQRG